MTDKIIQQLIQQALTLQKTEQYIESALLFDTILAQFPDLFDQLCDKRFISAYRGLKIAQDSCDWRYYDRLQRLVSMGVTQNAWVVGEMVLASSMFSNLDLLTFSSRYADVVMAQNPSMTNFSFTSKESTSKIKLGFVGADFFNQATAYLLSQSISRIDREQFEVIAYDYDPEDDSNVLSAYDRCVSIHNLSDEEAAQVIHSDEIEVLFNIKNPVSARLGIFARRPAPWQVHYLYFPCTSGMPFFDAIVADNIVIPPELEYAYSEQVWRIHGCYQPNDDQRVVPRKLRKSDFGLPEDAVVLANMGQCYKITPDIFDLWMRLLQKNPQCILWLLEQEDKNAEQHLRMEAQQRTVDPSRLYFSSGLAIPQHLSRLAVADIMLDTFPYGGHTLSSDALWAGTPLVTIAGDTFSSRVAASLLANVGLAELITYSYDEYFRLIHGLINDSTRRDNYRKHLCLNRHQFDVFDSTSYARRFENMVKHYVRGV